MTQTASVWLLLVVSFCVASLPFVNDRLIYAIAATLFLTFAFPGFVFRYLLRRGG